MSGYGAGRPAAVLTLVTFSSICSSHTRWDSQACNACHVQVHIPPLQVVTASKYTVLLLAPEHTCNSKHQ